MLPPQFGSWRPTIWKRRALFGFYLDQEDDDRAEEAGRRLLERFPDHLPTLDALSILYLRKDRPADALALLQAR